MILKTYVTESQIKRAILAAYGSREDLYLWNAPSGVAVSVDGKRPVRYGVPGQADIMGVWRRGAYYETARFVGMLSSQMVPIHYGQAIAIEVKRPGGQQSEAQRKWQAVWTRVGGIYVLARSVDDVAAVLGPPK